MQSATPAPIPQDPRPAEPSRAAARALLALLGEGEACAAPVPEADMRRVARDLLAQVAPSPPAEPEERRTPRRRLFSRIAPLAMPRPAEASSAARGEVEEAGPVRRVLPRNEAALGSGQSVSKAAPRAEALPRPIAAVPVARSAPPLLDAAAVRAIVARAAADTGPEHPAVVAIRLEGRKPLEQAGALRAMPRGQARAVHRALRQVQAAGGRA